MAEASTLTSPLQLDWRHGPDMPIAQSDYIQSVEVDGTVYAGGGKADESEDDYIVMAYSTQSCQWRTLPPYNTRYFAIAAMNQKLVVVGGENKDNSCSCELGEWQPDSNQWTHPYPPMSKCRYDSSAMAHKHWLVVVGGCHKYYMNVVEILDTFNMQWSIGPSAPKPFGEMKSTTIGDTWYLMGGYSANNLFGSQDVFKVSLEALVSHSTSESSEIWTRLPFLNCTWTCPLSIGGSLLALGGLHMQSSELVPTIQRYVPESNKWVHTGQLPQKLQGCAGVVVSDTVYVLGGLDFETRLNELVIAKLE